MQVLVPDIPLLIEELPDAELTLSHSLAVRQLRWLGGQSQVRSPVMQLLRAALGRGFHFMRRLAVTFDPVCVKGFEFGSLV